MNLDAAVKIAATVTGQSAVDGLKHSLDGVSKGVEGVTNRFAGLAGSVKMLAGALGILGLGAMVKDIINVGEELNDMAQKTGVSVEALSMFKSAGQLAGLSLEDLAKAFGKFDQALSKATTGNKEAAGAFKALHLNAATLKDMKVEDALMRIADAFAKTPDGADKTRVAMELFGKAGMNMIPLLNAGSQAIEAMGVKMTTDFAARADQFNDNLELMAMKTKVFAMQAAQAMLPVLQEIGTEILKLVDTKPNMIGFFDGVGEAARLLTLGVVGLYQGIATLVDMAITAGRQAGNVLTGDFAAAAALGDQFAERAKKRLDETAKMATALTKNSLLFGEGTVEEIKARRDAETSITPGKATASINTGALDRSKDAEAEAERKRLENSIKQYEAETSKIRTETAALTESALVKKELLALQDLEAKGIRAGTAAYARLKDERLAALQQQYEAERNFDTGVQQFFNDYVDRATNSAQQVKTVMQTAFKGMEDALVSFVTTGRVNFKQFANAIISDLARIAMQKAIAGIVGNLFSAAVGGATGGGDYPNGPVTTPLPEAMGDAFVGGKVHKFANGGAFTNSIATNPTMAPMAMFGEAGPEAIMPLSRGADGKLGVKSSGAGTTNITVNVATDGSTTTKGDAGTNAQQLGRAIAGAVRQELINQKRPGGILAPGANV